MRPVPVAVIGSQAVADGGEAGNYPTSDLSMRRTNSGIDNVSLYSGSGGIVVIISIQRQVALIDAIDAPGGSALSR